MKRGGGSKKEFEKKVPSKERDKKSLVGDQKDKQRKIMPCDDKGCDSACCFGCKCCEQRGKLISQKDIEIQDKNAEINSLKEKILGLMNKLKVGLGDAITDVAKENKTLKEERNKVNKENIILKNKVQELEIQMDKCKEIIAKISLDVNKTDAYLINDNKYKQVIKDKIMELKGKVEVGRKN
jgi:hypothetical protein